MDKKSKQWTKKHGQKNMDTKTWTKPKNKPWTKKANSGPKTNKPLRQTMDHGQKKQTNNGPGKKQKQTMDQKQSIEQQKQQ